MHAVANRFHRAAACYDAAAAVQAQVAARLVDAAFSDAAARSQSILDIGCGTGFVSEAAHRHWPEASLTALDAAPGMLKEAERKVPGLRTFTADAANLPDDRTYDLIFSSMMLHWLPDPVAALQSWRRLLNPGGWLYVAVPIAGSFQEWRDLCRTETRESGLWPLPPAAIAAGLAQRAEVETINAAYPNARQFVRQLKAIGAATPHPDHRPFDAATLRRLLSRAPVPFNVTYRILYIAMQSDDSN